jgi:excisionase family DNA binding protein
MESRLLLTASEAAERLAMSRATLYKLMASGEISSVHIGRSRRFLVAALEEYVRKLTSDGPEG